jgi:hypothetical protein
MSRRVSQMSRRVSRNVPAREPDVPPREPADSPPQPVGATPQPVDSPPQPADSPPQPVGAPPQPVDSPPQPVDSPPQPDGVTPQPVDSPLQPADSPPQPVGVTPALDGAPRELDGARVKPEALTGRARARPSRRRPAMHHTFARSLSGETPPSQPARRQRSGHESLYGREPLAIRTLLDRLARGHDGGHVLSGFFGDGARLPPAERGQVDEVGSYADREGSGGDEVGGVFQ